MHRSHKEIITPGGTEFPNETEFFAHLAYGLILCISTRPNKRGGIGDEGQTSVSKAFAAFFGIPVNEIVSPSNLSRAFALKFVKKHNPELYEQERGVCTDAVMIWCNKHRNDFSDPDNPAPDMDQQIDAQTAEQALYNLREQGYVGKEIPIVVVEGKAQFFLLYPALLELIKDPAQMPAILYLAVYANEQTAVERSRNDTIAQLKIQAKKLFPHQKQKKERKMWIKERIPTRKFVRKQRKDRNTEDNDRLPKVYPALVPKDGLTYEGIGKRAHLVMSSSCAKPEELVAAVLDVLDALDDKYEGVVDAIQPDVHRTDGRNHDTKGPQRRLLRLVLEKFAIA